MKKLLLFGFMVTFMLISSVSAQYLIDEGFEDATFPPTGWSMTQWSGTGVWVRMDYGGVTYYEPNGTGAWFATADSDEYSTDVFDVGLFSPVMDLSGETSVPFIAEVVFQEYTGCGEAAINTYSGGTAAGNFEEQLWYQNTDFAAATVSFNFDPSGYTNPAQVYVEFWYSTAGGTYCWNFAIDDVRIGNAAWIDLLGFEGKPQTNSVYLKWKTGAEIDCVGFNVYRSEIIGNGLMTEPVKVNDSVIPAQGSAHSGAVYTFVDGFITPSKYRYTLEEITTDGSENTAATTDVIFKTKKVR